MIQETARGLRPLEQETPNIHSSKDQNVSSPPKKKKTNPKANTVCSNHDNKGRN